MSEQESFWQALSSMQRVVLVFFGLLIVAVCAVLFFSLTKDQYVLLQDDLEPNDTATLVAELDAQKIDYQLTSGGTAVLVPEQSLEEAKVKLAGAGLTLGTGVGFEIFDDADFGMTEFAQKVNYQRALQGELSRTIMALEEIRYARLHLVLPEASIFRRDNNQPKAAITLVPEKDIVLTAGQVSGIRTLIASAVPGLLIENVAVHDHRGMNLAGTVNEDGWAGGGSGRLQRKQEVEAYMESKLINVLSMGLPNVSVAVSVNVSLNHDQVKQMTQTVLPIEGSNEGAPTSKRNSVTREPASIGATPGANAINKPLTTNSSTEVEYRYSTKTEETVVAPGNIEQLSVAVLVPQDITTLQMAKLRNLLAAAVGIDADRGDRIVIHSVVNPVWQKTAVNVSSDYLEHSIEDAAAIEVAGADAAEDLLVREGRQDKAPFAQGGSWLRANWIEIIIAVTVGLLLLFLLLGLMTRKSKGRATSMEHLSDAEREQVLADVRQWLNSKPEEAG